VAGDNLNNLCFVNNKNNLIKEIEMDNRNAIESFNIFKGIENEKNFPLKFEYGLGRLINGLEPIVKALDKLRTKKIEGQQEYEDAKQALIKETADKNDAGRPIQKQGPSGMEYVVSDFAALDAGLEALKEKHAEAIASIEKRVEEFSNLLEEDVEDFKPYKINVKYLPVDSDGNCKLSVIQLRFLIPFLNGEIDDIPDPIEE
jgi:hypothetical protein